MVYQNEIFLKFFLVFVMSFMYGLNRQKSHKPVGFGTFILISVGSCALAITAIDMNIDTSIALLAATVTGIGFLGAGALVRNSDKVFGFTTAASIWFFAIFGMMIGLGEYSSGFMIYTMVWIVAGFDKYLEKNAIGSYRRKIAIECKGFAPKETVTAILEKYTSEFYLYQISLNKKRKTSMLTYIIEGPKNEIDKLLKNIYSKNWCISVKFD